MESTNRRWFEQRDSCRRHFTLNALLMFDHQLFHYRIVTAELMPLMQFVQADSFLAALLAGPLGIHSCFQA